MCTPTNHKHTITMTLIKKMNPFNKAVTTTNLLSMALIMSTVSCGGCDDKEDEKGGELDFSASITTPSAAVANTQKHAELDGLIKVKKGEFDPEKWKIEVEEIKAIEAGKTTELGTNPVTLEQKDKTLKEAGLTSKVKPEGDKEGEGKFKVKFITSETNFNTTHKVGKVNAKLKVTGEITKNGKKEPKSVPVGAEFSVA